MSGIQNFRTAFRGFNRQDVVNYIEFMHNQHNSQIQQLNTQLQNAANRATDAELQARLEAAEAKIKELEAQLAQAGGDAAPVSCTEQELEAYRRAERAERIANERSAAICNQANAALAEAGLQVDNAASAIDEAAQKLELQLDAYKAAVADAKATLHQTADTLRTIAE